MYSIKEIYFTYQGEGYHTGRPSIFCRFSGCNLWSGYEKDREKAICNWCDTDFVGNNGINGGKYSKSQLINVFQKLWPKDQPALKYIVFTGGEPLLQLDQKLINSVHSIGFEIGVETNGTVLPPNGIDWICVSPKANSKFLLKTGNELKIVYPQENINPLDYENFEFAHFFIQPMDNINKKFNIMKSEEFISKNPKWKISLQTHKLLGIP